MVENIDSQVEWLNRMYVGLWQVGLWDADRRGDIGFDDDYGIDEL